MKDDVWRNVDIDPEALTLNENGNGTGFVAGICSMFDRDTEAESSGHTQTDIVANLKKTMLRLLGCLE